MTTIERKRMLAAFDRATRNARLDPKNLPELEPALKLWEIAWTAALHTGDEEKQALDKVYQHANGLTLGLDWNNGTSCSIHREKLIDAVKTVRELRGE